MPAMRRCPPPLSCAACLALAAASGCVQRTISITSDTAGALVWLNDREVGRTPLEVGFLYYGEYDVRLEREGFEPFLGSGDAKAPWWETAGIDLFAELMPVPLESRVRWHYALQPVNDDPDALLGRARELRDAIKGPTDAPSSP
jgi:hypothetical protein